MGTALGVHAGIVQPQPFDRPAANQVLCDDLFSVLRLHVPIPDSLWIHHHRRAMLALVQAARFVDAHRAARTGEAGGFRKLLQLRDQFTLAVAGAGTPRSALGTNILTDKHVTFKRRQNGKSPNPHNTGSSGKRFPQVEIRVAEVTGT